MVKAGVKAKVECLAKLHLTACICKVDPSQWQQQPEPVGAENEIDNRKLQLNVTVTFAEGIFII